MQATMRLDEPNIEICTNADFQSQHSYVQIKSFASHETGKGLFGYESVLNEFTIHGTPEQLRALANEIYRAFPEKELVLPEQPTYDDEAAKDFEWLEQARANTPEANMEQPEFTAKVPELKKASSF